jgi:hypothetical protein
MRRSALLLEIDLDVSRVHISFEITAPCPSGLSFIPVYDFGSFLPSHAYVGRLWAVQDVPCVLRFDCHR